jgi:hypothetical protein
MEAVHGREGNTLEALTEKKWFGPVSLLEFGISQLAWRFVALRGPFTDLGVDPSTKPHPGTVAHAHTQPLCFFRQQHAWDLLLLSPNLTWPRCKATHRAAQRVFQPFRLPRSSGRQGHDATETTTTTTTTCGGFRLGRIRFGLALGGHCGNASNFAVVGPHSE